MLHGPQGDDVTAEAAWDALNEALEDVTPPCNRLPLFVANYRTDDEREACEVICARCPVFDLCDAYAKAAADSGFWAGVERSPKRRRASSTTDAGAVISRQPSNTEKDTTS